MHLYTSPPSSSPSPPSDNEKGVLRVWTVSRSTPLETLALKDTGFHALCTTRAVRSQYAATQDLRDAETQTAKKVGAWNVYDNSN